MTRDNKEEDANPILYNITPTHIVWKYTQMLYIVYQAAGGSI